MMKDELIEEYRAAYAAANPDKPPVKVTYRNGWYHINDSHLLSPYRKTQIIEMRDRLRARAEERK
jgi:hypothetical protein